MTCNVTLKERFPRIDDPVEAINFAPDNAPSLMGARDFLEAWRDGAWDEIEMAYPEFLRQMAQ